MIFIIKGFRTIVFIFIVDSVFPIVFIHILYRVLTDWLSKFLRRCLVIFIIKGFWTVVFIFIVIDMKFMNSIFRIMPNRSLSNWSSPLLLGVVLCDFNLLAPGFCSSFVAAGLRWKWAFHRILLIKSTILSVKDRTNSCFPGNGMFVREYFGVIFSSISFLFLFFFIYPRSAQLVARSDISKLSS